MNSQEASEVTLTEYLRLTKEVLPALARRAVNGQGYKDAQKWPVTEDHCFQRIVLDNVCGGAWYDFIRSPAYKHLTKTQTEAAVLLCKRIIAGQEDLIQLNKNSLKWRQKQQSFSF